MRRVACLVVAVRLCVAAWIRVAPKVFVVNSRQGFVNMTVLSFVVVVDYVLIVTLLFCVVQKKDDYHD